MDYKGIYYGDNKVQKVFEYGAHFSYFDLYKKLELLKGINDEDNNNSMRNKSNENQHHIMYITDQSKYTILSRNNNKIYYNNPNTQNPNNKKIENMVKIRKKSAHFPIDFINDNIESYHKNKNTNLKKQEINEKNISNLKLNQKNIFKINSDNVEYYKNLNINNKNDINNHNFIHLKHNSLDNYNNQNITNNINLSVRTRNINYPYNVSDYIKSVENRISNIIFSHREKNNNNNNDVYFNKTIHPKNNKFIYGSPNVYRKKLNNINIQSGKYINKDLINYKLNPNRFNSGDNIFNKNIECFSNYNIYK